MGLGFPERIADMQSIFGIGTFIGLCKNIMIIFDVIGIVLASLTFIASIVPTFRYLFQKNPLHYVPVAVCRLFRLPYGQNLADFRDKVWLRYTSLAWISGQANNICRSGQDRAVAHLDRVVDRLINKARGILPFNSMLMAVIAFENSAISKIGNHALRSKLSLLQTSVLCALALSNILLLELFWVRWGKVEKKHKINAYENFSDEFNTTVIVCRDRAIILDVAIILSVLCVTCIIIIRFYAT